MLFLDYSGLNQLLKAIKLGHLRGLTEEKVKEGRIGTTQSQKEHIKPKRQKGRMEPDSTRASGNIHQSSTAQFPPEATADWATLPLIVQDLILEELADKYKCDSPEDRKNRAAYAAVCSEWQGFFESRSFGKLVLHPSSLGAFEKIVQRRQSNNPVKKGDRTSWRRRQKPVGKASPPAGSRMPRIKHIWLRVELQQYDCRNCRAPEDSVETVRYVIL
jgi:hypothetical protein